MAEKSFVLMSLKEKQSKKLASLLNSDTARKILDYLSTVEYATETQISKETGTALSTVHYNLKLLRENKLVNEEEYHYSEKGKEVIHYKAANKYIIIAPEGEDDSILEKLKNILPGFIGLIVGSVVLFSYKLFGKTPMVNAGIPQTFASEGARAATDVAESKVSGALMRSSVDAIVETNKTLINESVRSAPDTISTATQQVTQQTTQYATNMPTIVDPWIWFLLGGLFVLLIIVLYVLIKNSVDKAKKKRIKPLNSKK